MILITCGPAHIRLILSGEGDLKFRIGPFPMELREQSRMSEAIKRTGVQEIDRSTALGSASSLGPCFLSRGSHATGPPQPPAIFEADDTIFSHH